MSLCGPELPENRGLVPTHQSHSATLPSDFQPDPAAKEAVQKCSDTDPFSMFGSGGTTGDVTPFASNLVLFSDHHPPLHACFQLPSLRVEPIFCFCQGARTASAFEFSKGPHRLWLLRHLFQLIRT